MAGVLSNRLFLTSRVNLLSRGLLRQNNGHCTQQHHSRRDPQPKTHRPLQFSAVRSAPDGGPLHQAAGDAEALGVVGKWAESLLPEEHRFAALRLIGYYAAMQGAPDDVQSQ